MKKEEKIERHNFKWAFIFMKLYIFLNMLFNIGSKYLQSLEHPYTACEIGFVRSAISMVICFVILRRLNIPVYFGVPFEDRKWLFVRAFWGIFYFWVYTYSLGIGAVSTVFLSQNLAPMLTSVLAFYIFKEFLSKLDIVSLFIGFGGIMLILIPKEDNGKHISYGPIEIMAILSLPIFLTGL